MSLLLNCPGCETKLKVPDHLAGTGKLIKCPKCQEKIPLAGFAVPGTEATSATAPSPLPLSPSPGERGRGEGGATASKRTAPERHARGDDDGAPAAEKKAPAANKPAKSKPKAETDLSADADEALDDLFEAEGVPPQYRKAIRKELDEDEKVVWLGRPVLEIQVRKAKVGLIIGIVLCVVALGLLAAGIAMGIVPMIIVGGILTPISILCMLAPFLVKRFAGGRAVYLVTSRRAILYPPLRSYTRRQLHNKLELRESSYQEGAGSLIFEIQTEYNTVNTGTVSSLGAPGRIRGAGGSTNKVEKQVTEYGFMDIAEVIAVEKLIRNTILRPKTGEPEPEGGAVEDHVEETAAVEPRPKKGASRGHDEDFEDAPGKGKKAGRVFLDAAGDDTRDLIENLDVAEKLKDKALKRLDGDEKVIWVGQPFQKLILLRSLGISAVMLALLVLTLVAGLRGGKPNATLLASSAVLVLVAIGAPIVRRLRAARTLYVLTQRRASVYEPNWFGMMTVCDYKPDILSRMSRKNSWLVKGAGDLVFRKLTQIKTTQYVERGTGRNLGSRSSVTTFYWGFLAINNIAQVEELINDHVVEPYLDRVNA